jgi:hypothetical protein
MIGSVVGLVNLGIHCFNEIPNKIMSSTDYSNEFDDVELNLIRKVMKKSESFHNFALDYLEMG